MTSHCRRFLNFGAHERPTVGDTKMSFTEYDHLGWLKCDGRILTIESFQLLYLVVGRAFTEPGLPATQFRLPDGKGRVPGMPGNGTSGPCSAISYIKGDSIGEQKHLLTIPEMPSHNHGVTGSNQIASNNSTSMEYTGITLTDPTHTHANNSGGGTSDYGLVQIGGDATTAGGDGLLDFSPAEPNLVTSPIALVTSSSTTGVYITDPTHAHTIHAAGGDECHNNMQPTLFIGNMYIFCGRINYGQTGNYTSFPYTVGNAVL